MKTVKSKDFYWYKMKEIKKVFVVDKETNNNKINVKADDKILTHLKKDMVLMVGSTAEKCRIFSINKNTITLDKAVKSANQNKLIAGEIFIIE